MTDTSVHIPPTAHGPGGFRRGSLLVFRGLAGITLLACVVQIVFAGLGAYGASFDAHRVLGGLIGLATILLVVIGLLARPNWSTVGLAVLVAVLAMAGQTILANLGDDTDAWFGGIHALNGLVVMGLLSRLAFNVGFPDDRPAEAGE